MKTRLPWLGLAALATAAWPAQLPAQSRELKTLLQHATRVECKFTEMATADWKDGKPGIEPAAATLEATFDAIDVDTGTAESESSYGTSYIIVRYSDGYLHFMQTLSSGPIYVTTVFAEPAGTGRLKAVQTRLEYSRVALPGFTSRPEIYVGDCAVSEDSADSD